MDSSGEESDGKRSRDEESEEEEIVQKRRKRKTGAMNFIDDEVVVDDDEDEDEDDEVEAGFEQIDDYEEQIRDKNRHHALDARKQREQEVDAEEIAARIDERYKRNMSIGAFRGDLDHVPQSVLIPSVHDTKLWLVSCKPGKEKSIVLNVMKRYFASMNSDKPISIASCFCRDSIAGYVYIEASKQAHVANAINNLANVYITKMRLVPINEMVDCLNIKAKDSTLAIDSWARVKKGKYQGDLAKVLEVSENGESCILKLIPRLDLDSSKKSSTRQPQKLFNPKDAPGNVQKADKGGHFYQSDFYDSFGYLEKSFKTSALETKNINPTLEEITKFNGGIISEKNEDLAMLASANVASSDDFSVGEAVVAIAGELKNISGTVKAVERGIVTIIPLKEYSIAPFKYPAKDVSKLFKDGDHVKVINGMHKEETGLVIEIDENVVTMLSDTTLKPVQVFSKDLRTASEIFTSTYATQYDIGDLVTLS
jgi:transcription elongation factor SPT5